MTARRKFFTNVAALAAGTLGLTACGEEAETDLSSNAGRKLLDAFVDTIVPKDQNPGAVEAGIPDDLLTWFDKNKDVKKQSVVMLATIDRLAARQFKAGFKELHLEQRENILELLISSRDRKDHPARNMYYRLRAKIIRKFYLSPAGRAMLAYSPPYPMGYPDYNRAPPD